MVGVFGMVANARGNHWQKSYDECLTVARPLSQYIDKMAPDLSKKLGPALLPISIVSSLAILVLPSLVIDNQLNEMKKQNRQTTQRKVNENLPPDFVDRTEYKVSDFTNKVNPDDPRFINPPEDTV